jgi:hypothetical protein
VIHPARHPVIHPARHPVIHPARHPGIHPARHPCTILQPSCFAFIYIRHGRHPQVMIASLFRRSGHRITQEQISRPIRVLPRAGIPVLHGLRMEHQ